MESPQKPFVGEKVALCFGGLCPTAQLQSNGTCTIEDDGKLITLPPEAARKLAELIQQRK